jgi:hypothetical protein
MAPVLDKLRKQAKKLGVPTKEIRVASREELESLIAEHSDNGGTRKKSKARKAVRKAVAKKKVAAKSAPARKSRTSGKAKRQTTRKSESTSGYEAKGARNTLDGVDYSETDGWNPRPGSTADRIVKLLKKYKGNRDKVYDALLSDIGDFVKPKRADGSAWVKGDGPGSRKAMLRYRISRTAWQFALNTGQHEIAGNRVEYGTGGTGEGRFKRKSRKTAATRKSGRKTTTAARKPQKAAQKRTGTTRRRTTTRRRSSR